jgi:hypothetical protein
MAIGRSAVSPASVSSPVAVPSAYLLARIRSEFHEMPGLRLTLLQARRLFGLEIMACSSALAALESAGFLTTTRDGAYVMAPRRQMTA